LGSLLAAAGRLLLLPHAAAVAITGIVVEPRQAPVETPPQRKTSVRVATWLSVIPGVGQLYNRQPRKAAIFLFGVLLSAFVTLNLPGFTTVLVTWWKPSGSLMVILSLAVQMFSLLIFMGTFLLALTIWYDAMHDARATAQEINGERQPRGRWWLFHK
jgi:arabinogalactan oligomer / maltooligosaccharide transport system permease protein